MFGIKNPGKMLGMLKMFGVKPETLLSQLEDVAVKKWQDLQTEAAGPLTAVAVLDETGTHFILSLYKIEENNTLNLWRSFPLKNIEQILKKIENTDDTANTAPQQVAAIAAGTADTGSDTAAGATSAGATDGTANA